MLSGILEALSCGYPAWREAMGDPLLPAMVFMSAYAGCAVLLFRTARLSRSPLERGLWRACGLSCLLLLVNVTLDLQVLAWSGARCLAQAEGWYDARRQVQMSVMASVVIASVAVVLIVLIASRRHIVSNTLLVAGMAIALAVVAIEAIGINSVDRFFADSRKLLGGGDPLEQFVGIAIMVLAALIRQRSAGQHHAAKPVRHRPEPEDFRPKLR